MKTTKDILATVGSYEDKTTGQMKNKYQKVGVLFTNEEGKQSLKLEPWFNPAGATNEKGDCWLSIVDQQAKSKTFNAPSPTLQTPLQSDAIPF